jgi:hypothetical protein
VLTEEAARARFEDRELLRQFQEVEDLPDDDRPSSRSSSTPSSQKHLQRLAG